ncbi:hypothetical protein GCM10020331_032880 [Ectobacillus funiculus]
MAGKLNDTLLDLKTPIQEDGSIAIVTLDTKEGAEIFASLYSPFACTGVKAFV